jgi:GNAT superfamily N-acetyltransferase
MNQNPKISIRRAMTDDLETIVDFNAALAKESEGIILERERLKEGIKAALDDPQKCLYFMAELDGKIVGQTMITFEWSDWRNGFFWWIQSVYVPPEMRRKGVFRAIFEHIRSLAESEKTVCGLRLYVDRNNPIAIQTYLNLGLRRAQFDMYEIDFVISRHLE